MKKAKVSIVIPCYNEEKRLEPSLSKALSYISSNVKIPFEIIFVDDGSTDKTEEMLNEIKSKNSHLNIEILTYSQNQGKGYAVKVGVLNAHGDKIIVTDADFSIDLREMNKFIDHLDLYDLVIGTKKHLLTQTVKHQKAPRRILGKGFTMLTNFLMGINFTDITCGFKGFKAGPAKKMFSKIKMTSWSYDAEILFLANKLNYSAIEVPVRWYHIEGSKVSPFIDTFKSLHDLIKILLNYYNGIYN